MYTGPNIITDGLVLHLDAANTKSYPGSGNTWSDLSGFESDGNIVGPSYNLTDRTFTYTNGDKVGFGIDGGNLNVNPGESNKLSVLAWVNPNNPSDSRAPIVRIDRWYFQVYSQDRLASYWYGRNPSGYHYSNPNTVPMNKWSFVGVIWNENSVKFYINGQLDKTINNVGGIGDNNDYLRVGFENAGREYEGNISSVFVYNKGLSVSEVLRNYNATKSRFNL